MNLWDLWQDMETHRPHGQEGRHRCPAVCLLTHLDRRS